MMKPGSCQNINYTEVKIFSKYCEIWILPRDFPICQLLLSSPLDLPFWTSCKPRSTCGAQARSSRRNVEPKYLLQGHTFHWAGPVQLVNSPLLRGRWEKRKGLGSRIKSILLKTKVMSIPDSWLPNDFTIFFALKVT